MKNTVNEFDLFFEAMLACALRSTSNENDVPLDSYHTIADIDPDCASALKAHAMSFWLRMWFYIDHEKPGFVNCPIRQAGRDFWLTSQGHGCGFWDGSWPVYGDTLTKLSKCYPGEMEITFK